MKQYNFFILTLFLISLTCCWQKEAQESGIYFYSASKRDDVIIKYSEIIGYDSTRYIFQISKQAWERINDTISNHYFSERYEIGIALNDKALYKATFIPPHNSMIFSSIITFRLEEPGFIYMKAGYPGNLEIFTGDDLRNNQELINYMGNDNKLIKIKTSTGHNE